MADTRTTIAKRVGLNAIGVGNSEVELWVNGKSVIRITGFIFKTKYWDRPRVRKLVVTVLHLPMPVLR